MKLGIMLDLFKQTCRPFTGAWIETRTLEGAGNLLDVAPSRGRGLKPWNTAELNIFVPVAPSRGRGLKHC